MRSTGRVTAVLGPTNTGKTHYAIERMLGHRTGVIGLPLRLLAREVYDRCVAQRGPNVVALVTGEERIVPERTQYWVCTVEAMPLEIGADFIAIDEIQLCADAERGHVFTDRLLRARGLHETLFLGADTMRSAIAALVPGVQFMARPRLSELTYAGSKKISRMPERSAIVGFSVENVYAIAELIRRTKGGCAVVMGALSPRTRNAQVDLYQNGDVDFLVATDAIGMGLNLDIRHVAFSSTAKFDGRRMRGLYPQELAQIAGRAGRHMTAGSFGVTGEARPLHDDVVDAIENHRFAPVRKLSWRNEQLAFGTIERLIGALEQHTGDEWLSRARDADDVTALKALSAIPEIRDRVKSPQDVRLLWDVCRIPDFRGISSTEHATLLHGIFDYLRQGQIPADWMAAQINRIDRVEGDIDTLSKRLAFIRTWTYVAQRKNWVADESHWRDATRAVEDRLSDALHAALTQRFVDRRTSVLMRRLKQKESLVAEVNDKGEVTVEGEFVGRLEGFRFRQDASASVDEARTLRLAAVQALKPEFHLRSDKFYNAPDTELDFTEQGGLMWGSSALGKLVAGPDAMRPTVEAFVDEDAGPEIAEKVKRRLQHFIDRKVATLFEPLLGLSRDEALTGMARGFAFRLVEALGVLPRDAVAEEVKSLDQEARGQLRKHGIRFGQYTIFQPLLLKPAPTRLRLVLWSLANGLQEFPESPPPGLVTIPNIADVPQNHYTLAGYRPAGARAIRIDMLERLADLLRAKDSRAGFEATPDMLSITGMTLEQFADLMAGLGYHVDKGERVKAVAPSSEPPPGTPVADVAMDLPADPAGDAPIAIEVTPAVDEATELGVDAETGAPVVHTDATPEDAVQPVPEIGGIDTPRDDLQTSDAPDDVLPGAEPPAPEMESFVTFTWAPRPRGNSRPPRRDRVAGEASQLREAGKPRGERPQVDRPQGDRPKGDGPRREGGFKGKGKGKPGGKPPHNSPQKFEARPARPEKKIDPDNPFAALAALKGKI
ncbi:helicase-related protein [Pseudorhodobacter sp.]|uniref:helicase-related protein n=1 Tax=Pseudorhodobacter sp. TaxID=1934400 RepID=UPI002647654F|nr:helicase-related protein [Pseudorhodobacter sp.]MDN5787231.1 helicase [Pseudorhodobacter sp.]